MRKSLYCLLLALACHLASAAPTYNGGGILTGDTTVNLVVYGWGASSPTVQPIFHSFISNIDQSVWWDITQEYHDASFHYPANVHLGQVLTIDSSQYGTSLDQGLIETIARRGPQQGGNNVNFVLTGPGIAVDGFGTRNCGWHANRGSFLFGFIGDAQNVPGCLDSVVQFRGDHFVGGMLSVLAHELTETVTDPYVGSGWREPGPQTNTTGRENADMCAWSYSGVQQDSFGSYNQSFGGEHYMIQDNYLLVGFTYHPNNCAHSAQPEAPKTINCPPHVICKPEVDRSVYVSPLVDTISDVADPVPEPAAVAMLSVGLMGLVVLGRRGGVRLARRGHDPGIPGGH